MMKWLTQYIDENTDKWTRQKKEREENEKKWLQDWARMTRMEKIQTIREKETNQQTLNVTVLPEKFKQPENPLKPTTNQTENLSVEQPSQTFQHHPQESPSRKKIP